MKNPLIKTKKEPRRTGFLQFPSDDLSNDEEMYSAVRKAGKAVIMVFHSQEGDEGIRTVTPPDFQADWMGD